MDRVINLKLMANPVNWIIVWTMALLAAILGHYLLTWAGVSHSPDATNS